MDDSHDWAAEEEAKWRSDAQAWATQDFFEVSKAQFRKPNFIPVSTRSVVDAFAHLGPGSEGMASMLQDGCREHGCPDEERYRDKEYLCVGCEEVDGWTSAIHGME